MLKRQDLAYFVLIGLKMASIGVGIRDKEEDLKSDYLHLFWRPNNVMQILLELE